VGTAMSDDSAGSRRFRRTLASVMFVQIVTLCALWLLQWRYSA
jgi:hypothetical protein